MRRMHALVRATIHSRLDYCNIILANPPLGLLNCLQSVTRSSARLVLRRWAGVSRPIRDQLHWLPLQQRIAFKLCTVAHKCIHPSASLGYMSYRCISTGACCTSFCCILSSIDPGHWDLNCLTAWFLYNACPATCNSLPSQLTADNSLSLSTFRKQLNAALFRYRGILQNAFMTCLVVNLR